MPMDLSELQQRVQTWRWSRERLNVDLDLCAIEHAAMVIAEEAGEVLACISKSEKEHLPEELADVVIAVADVANLVHVNLEQEIQKKLDKLEARTGLRHRRG